MSYRVFGTSKAQADMKFNGLGQGDMQLGDGGQAHRDKDYGDMGSGSRDVWLVGGVMYRDRGCGGGILI